MTRTVTGQAHLDTRATTTTQCLRIAPVDGDVFGLTLTNIDLPIDDGQGLVNYLAAHGFDDSAYSANAGQGVDNAEASILVAPLANLGITMDMVNSGYLDGAQFHVYLVNWADLSVIALLHYGYLGEIRYDDSQLVVPELRSLSQMAKQRAVCEAGSKTCRATYADASTGCYAVAPWTAASVTTAGAETDRIFNTAATIPAPGLVRFTSGANLGRSLEVESFASGVVSLVHPAPYPIEDGATFEWRDDCDKKFTTCKLKGQHKNFRGEPYRPESLGDALQTPGGTTR